MASTRELAAPVALAGALGAGIHRLLGRMEREYATRDTLTRVTVAAMYAGYGGYVAAMAWAAHARVWPMRLPARASRIGGLTLALTGLGTAVAGASPFGPSRQLSGIEPGSMHTGGVYRYSRNPQYLGLGLAATGSALAARSALTGLLAAGVWAAYRRWIPAEEHHLGRMFGQQYANYRARVRRWIGTYPPRVGAAETNRGTTRI